MIMIPNWRIVPELRLAQNIHNGAIAELDPSGDDYWQLSCINCPARYMLDILARWWQENLPTDRKIISDAERYHAMHYECIMIRRDV